LSDLLVIEFPSEAKAEGVRETLLAMQKKYLIGLLFMMPLAGATLGAASGALGGKLADLGINDDFMRQAARTLQSGNAALFLLIRKMTTDKMLAALRGVGGTVMRSSFDETKEEALREALADVRAASVGAAG